METSTNLIPFTSMGLVLEGGGMRGLYTAGVLDFFLDQNLHFPYVIGVSAGACHAASYISQQKGRNKIVNIGYIQDPRYISYRNLLKTKSLFGMDFVFNEIPNRLEPFDYETLYRSKQKYIIGTTDCQSGQSMYFEKSECDPDIILKVLMASSSLPFVSPTVNIKGQHLLDGGIADPIPIQKSLRDGNSKNVIILTRNKEYRKKPFNYKWFARRFYSRYPGLVDALLKRHEVYNSALEQIETMEEQHQAFILRPSEPLKVDRLERNPQKLTHLYSLGYRDAQTSMEQIKKFIDSAVL